MKKEPKIFVIIVTYKGKQWYDKCFGSLRELTIPVQTIAVDNSPTEEDAEYIKSHFPEVHLIKTNENLGFGRANNIGMRYALDNECDYVFLLNQDAWLDTPDAIEKLVRTYEEHPEYGILSPMHLNVKKDGLVMGSFCRRPCNQALIEDLYLHQLKDIYSTDYIHAAAWMLSRNTIETVGGFDPIFKHYEEDDNYLYRVLYHGLKIGVCPASRIVHDHHDSPLSNEQALIRQRQFLLVEWTNINRPFLISAQCRYYLRKWLSCMGARNWSRAKNEYTNLSYCVKMRKAILYSRSENIKKQASWI